MPNMRFLSSGLILFLVILMSGCISLKAGYVKETPQERTQKTVGVDTSELFQK